MPSSTSVAFIVPTVVWFSLIVNVVPDVNIGASFTSFTIIVNSVEVLNFPSDADIIKL